MQSIQFVVRSAVVLPLVPKHRSALKHLVDHQILIILVLARQTPPKRQL